MAHWARLRNVCAHMAPSAAETMNDFAMRTPLSPTLAIKDTADEMRAAGIQLFDFGIGETNPEIPVPDIIKQTIASATLAEENHYSPAQGDPALLEAIALDLGENFDIPTSVDQICVCPGPKDAIFKAAFAMTNGRAKRRRFICFAPIYESFISIPLLVSGEDPIVLQTDAKTFLPNPSDLRRALTENDDVCCVIVNSPNNPTGAIYPKQLLQELAAVLMDFPQVWALSDEVYRTVRYEPGRHASLRQYLPEQTVSVSGMSKEASGTGLRLGFCAGPLKLIELIRSIQSNSSSCVNLPTQRAYEKLLRHDVAHNMELRGSIVAQLQARQQRLLVAFDAALQRHPAVSDAVFAHVAQGAFCAYAPLVLSRVAQLGHRTVCLNCTALPPRICLRRNSLTVC